MEKKVIFMQKVLSILLVTVIVVWSLLTQDFKTPAAYLGLFLVIVVAVAIFKSNKKVDERDMYIHLAASYFSLISTICFIFVMQTVEYFRFHSVNKIYGIILAVLMLSQFVSSLVLRKTAK